MKKLFLVFTLLTSATFSSWAQQLFTNGSILTGATSKSGVAAPTGTQWSEVQNDTGNTAVANTNSGYTANQSLSYQLADDFVVPAGQSWTVSSFNFFGYQTGAGATTSPFTELYIQVWNGQPGTAGATVVFGNLTTNRLGTSTDAAAYRIFNSLYPTAAAPTTTRKVWEVAATVSPALVLPAGTYWISWSSNVTANATHFFVPVTTVGARTQTGANALQGVTASGTTTWTALTDAGTGTGATTVNQAMAFRVLGTTTTPSAGTPLFNNGATSLTASSIATGATSKSGVAAPTGTQWSEVQNDTGNTAVANTNSGYTASQSLSPSLELADDFVVPAGQSWTVNSFSFFGYQTGAAATPSPFATLSIRVWRGQPGTAGATVVFGDATTNRLGTSTDALTYRVFNSLYPTPAAPGTTRKVWEVQATVAPAVVLTPGTYWVSWSSTVTGGGTHFYVPVTTVGARTQTGANALQGSTTAGVTTWTALVDAGTGTGATSVNQAMAFKVFGTTGPLATRVGQPGPDGLSIQASPVPASDAVQIDLDHLKGNAQLLLTDLNGRLVWTGAVPTGRNTATVPVAGLAAGIYLLEARTATGSVRARLVKE
ncbi:T9SS type A sorting domain-containing protein [Hymenobacter negativus]|uniref:T9SS type A sorting domain-containing protein n=1 Tax=Hymenobacter negativus TaxID=2795026 RepID=A0ABS3QKS6_9BACT|nr:T9SS type A sorting domain-containing protein [Hymenobacter negativus]MBO2011847.1 T9SS type A sorting domain-containing protein [Hymenobacter negativus]